MGCYRLSFAETVRDWKDQAESELYEAIANQSDPARKLALLDTWTSRYPATAFLDLRSHEYLSTYAKLGSPRDVLRVAGEVLDREPDNQEAMSSAMVSLFSIDDPAPVELVTAEHAATVALTRIDTLFQDERKPQAVTAEAWAAARQNVQVHARNTIGYVAWKRKVYDKAERDFTETLNVEPRQPQVSYWLSSVILAQRKPEKYSLALFEMARAATYTGPAAFNDATRKQVRESFLEAYKTHHGSEEGSEAVLEAAAAQALPPASFHIASRMEKLRAENPSLAAWQTIAAALTVSDGAQYFASRLQDTELPEFTGKVISVKAREIEVAVADPAVADVTLLLADPRSVRLSAGTTIAFRGVARSYTSDPYRITVFVPKGYLRTTGSR